MAKINWVRKGPLLFEAEVQGPLAEYVNVDDESQTRMLPAYRMGFSLFWQDKQTSLDFTGSLLENTTAFLEKDPVPRTHEEAFAWAEKKIEARVRKALERAETLKTWATEAGLL